MIVSSYTCYLESLDSYTCRVSASVLTNSSFINGHINTSQWLKQVIIDIIMYMCSFVHMCPLYIYVHMYINMYMCTHVHILCAKHVNVH